MSTQTTQGTGPGSAERYSRGSDGGNRVSVAGPYVVAAGHCVTTGVEGHGDWQVQVSFPEALSFNPRDYVVMVTQDDYDSNDGRNEYPPHIEKLDAYGNNEDEGYEGGFGGFMLHTGDSSERRFMWTVIKTGFKKD